MIKRFIKTSLVALLVMSCTSRSTQSTDINHKTIVADSVSQQMEENSNTIINEDYYEKYSGCIKRNDSEDFKLEYFPFKWVNFNSSALLRYFKSDVSVDSVESNFEGSISHIYTFSDKESSISFFVKTYDKEDRFFYLDGADINTNLFQSKNGIQIGLSRNDFFKKIKYPISKCDTFIIQEGDLSTYYCFIFSGDTLKKIKIESEK